MVYEVMQMDLPYEVPLPSLRVRKELPTLSLASFATSVTVSTRGFSIEPLGEHQAVQGHESGRHFAPITRSCEKAKNNREHSPVIDILMWPPDIR